MSNDEVRTEIMPQLNVKEKPQRSKKKKSVEADFESVKDFPSNLIIKVLYEVDNKRRSDDFDKYQFVTSKIFEPLDDDKEVEGYKSIPGAKRLKEGDMKPGLKCFALWHDMMFYQVVILEVKNKTLPNKKRGNTVEQDKNLCAMEQINKKHKKEAKTAQLNQLAERKMNELKTYVKNQTPVMPFKPILQHSVSDMIGSCSKSTSGDSRRRNETTLLYPPVDSFSYHQPSYDRINEAMSMSNYDETVLYPHTNSTFISSTQIKEPINSSFANTPPRSFGSMLASSFGSELECGNCILLHQQIQRKDSMVISLQRKYDDLKKSIPAARLSPSTNNLIPENEIDTIELIPKSGVRIKPVTLATSKSYSTGGKAMCFLLKKFYSQETLARSSLSNKSKDGFNQLPIKEIEAIKAFIVCTFKASDGKSMQQSSMNHLINSTCCQARMLLKKRQTMVRAL